MGRSVGRRFGRVNPVPDAPVAAGDGTMFALGGLFGMLFYLTAALPLPGNDTVAIVSAIQEASRYPASFGNLWYSFALALFSTLTMTSVSLAMIVDNARCLKLYRIKWNDPAHIYMRIQMAGFAVFVLGCGGDVATLLLWGDVSGRTMELALAVDRYMDFIAIGPFLYYVWLRTRSQPITLYYLKSNPPADTRPTFPMVRRHLAMVGTCLFVALLVALTK